MILNAARLTPPDPLPLQTRDPKHFRSPQFPAPVGESVSELKHKIGPDAIADRDSFQDALLRALDTVSADQRKASGLIETAITNPDSVDIHDVTIAQAKATMSMNVTRTVLSRLVQGWRDLVNLR
ncbi:MAG: flagellar hook-basal body complex protein FliE [Spirochaetaceae bacterium]|jgi:flagellar hook-basal body complex protein FliE|nr:flagellar hook-basal body complex protein FliE [Spirochaetaceae bacterium]